MAGAPHGLLAVAVVLPIGCCDPMLRLPNASSPADDDDCRGEVFEYRDRMSFLLPFVDDADESIGEVGPECQSKSNRPPPPPAFSALLVAGAATVELVLEAAATTVLADDEGGGESSSEVELRGLETLVVAGPGPTSPPSRSIALAAGTRAFEDAAEEEAGAALLADAAGAGEELPPSSVLGSDGTGPSFAHLLTSYLLRIKLSTLCSGGT